MVLNKLNWVCYFNFYSISKYRKELQYNIFIYYGYNFSDQLFNISFFSKGLMIRNLEQKDKVTWNKLYSKYADFYKVPMNTVILDTLWGWIHDENHIVNGICFELENKIVGIAHYRTMPRPIKGQYIGFLDDLFVEPDFRGQKIAQKLINHLKSLSKGNNWDGIRWITHFSNENAKKLYDKIANNTGFELYELKRD